MKICFRDMSKNTYEIDVDEKKASIPYVIELLKKQEKFPTDKDTKLFFSNKVIQNDDQLKDTLSLARGRDGFFDDCDPILLIFKNKVAPSNEQPISEQAPIKEVVETVEKKDLMGVFKTQVENYPNAIAGTYEGKVLSYLEIDQKSSQLANFLSQNYPIGSNVPVAIMGSNKLEMVICELAILKAGGCFVPFEPNTPPERLNTTLKTSNAALIIACDDESKGVLLSQSMSCPTLDLLEKKEEIAAMDNHLINPYKNKPSDLAYILYTSGSTGATPKGVMQTRGGLQGQIENYKENLAITDEDHFLQLAPLTHDQAIVDTYGALLNGAELHLVDMDLEKLDPRSLKQIISENKITIFSSIPSVFSMIFEDVENDTSFPHLRIVTLGGEAVKVDHVKLYQQIAQPNCLFINGYGATEFSWISYHIIKKDDSLENMTSIPLGTMASKTEVYLDYTNGEKGKGIGELCVSCPFMSPGYWHNKDATDKAFFMKEGKAFYRTGDLVSIDEAGIYHFEGRLNWHEKINGKRINLKDIEDRMSQNFPFEECVVISHGEDPKRLYAFYTLKHGEKFNKTEVEIRHKLAESLKNYEIPFKFFALEEFPKLPNGKVNRQELNNVITEKQQNQKPIEINEELHIVDKLFIQFFDLETVPENDYNYRDHGVSSLDFFRFFNELNSYLATERPLIQIALSEMTKTETISDIKKLIENTYKNLNSTEDPIYEEKNINTYDYYPSFYLDSENTSTIFNFSSVVVLANYYNKVYNISINPCESQEQFLEKMDQFLENREPGQIGLTWPRNNIKEAHYTPCILNIDEEGKASLFISDSIGLFLTEDEKLIKHDSPIPVKIYVDPYSRQQDEDSCGIDGMAYLKDALRLNLTEDLKIIDPEEVFRDRYSRADYPPEVTFFQNPPELLKHSQSLDFPSDLYNQIDTKAPLKNSKKNENLEEYRRRNTKKVVFLQTSGDASPTIELEKNVSLYKKGKKFRGIIDKNKEEPKTE